MTDRYKALFEKLAPEHEQVFIPFLLLGWPDPQTALELARRAIQSGVSALQFGWAFSNPIAGSSSMQEAAFETLSLGFGLEEALVQVHEIRLLDANIPLGLLMYYNMIRQTGFNAFFSMVAEAGVDSVLIAELPLPLFEDACKLANKHGISIIPVITTATATSELPRLLRRQPVSFIYAAAQLQHAQLPYLAQVKQIVEQVRLFNAHEPVCVPARVSDGTDVEALKELGVQGIISGDILIEMIAAGRETDNPFRVIDAYLQSMLAATGPSKKEEPPDI